MGWEVTVLTDQPETIDSLNKTLPMPTLYKVKK